MDGCLHVSKTTMPCSSYRQPYPRYNVFLQSSLLKGRPVLLSHLTLTPTLRIRWCCYPCLTERFSDLHKPTQFKSSRAGICSQAAWLPQCLSSSPHGSHFPFLQLSPPPTPPQRHLSRFWNPTSLILLVSVLWRLSYFSPMRHVIFPNKLSITWRSV